MNEVWDRANIMVQEDVNGTPTWIEYDGTNAPGHGSPATNVYYAFSLGSQIGFGVTLEDPHDHHGASGAVPMKVRVYLKTNGVVTFDDYTAVQSVGCGYVN